MPKYKIGDVVRTRGGETFTISFVDPSKPKNCYHVTGVRGGRYICGDHDIVAAKHQPSSSLSTEASGLVDELNIAHEMWLENKGVSYEDYSAKEKPIWDRLQAIDEELRPQGMVPGRLLRWGAADGEAVYLLVSIGHTTCDLKHIEYMDGYCSPAVTLSGKALREIVEHNLRYADSLASYLAN